jgi:hypothetical protein
MYKVALMLLAAITGGCSTYPVKMYDGPEKTVSELSTIRLWSPSVIVRSIDGKPATSTGRESHAYLVPGNHEFSVQYLFANTISTLVTLRAETKAGHTYTFGFQLYGDDVTPQENRVPVLVRGYGALTEAGKVSFHIQDKGQNYDPDCLILKPLAEGGTEGKNC